MVAIAQMNLTQIWFVYQCAQYATQLSHHSLVFHLLAKSIQWFEHRWGMIRTQGHMKLHYYVTNEKLFF